MMQYKSLMQATKYIIHMNNYFFHMKPDGNLNGQLELCGYSDIEYVGDNGTKERVKGYVILVNRVVVAWHLWIQ